MIRTTSIDSLSNQESQVKSINEQKKYMKVKIFVIISQEKFIFILNFLSKFQLQEAFIILTLILISEQLITR